MAEIPIGARSELQLLVTGEVAIDFLGLDSARVLGTPFLIGYLEMAARNAIKEHLEPGYDSVGTHVDVRHRAATPVGMQVRFLAEITAVDVRRVTCRVEAHDEKEKVAEGTHERFIIHVERFATRLQAKKAAP